MVDLQLRSDDQRIHLLRKAENGRYRAVTSQRDWTTYHGDSGGNRYSPLTLIAKSNVSGLAPRWVFPLAGVTGRAEIMDSIHGSGLGGTYGGNPVACAAAMAAGA